MFNKSARIFLKQALRLRFGTNMYRHFNGFPVLFTRNSIATSDVLLSDTNRQVVMDRMRKAPAVGIKMENSRHEAKSAAVLIALIPHDNNVSILYTRRSHRLSRHIRQISFPGGMKDPTDKDFIDCALRETEEEIGLPREQIEIWGTGCLITPPRTAAIMPVVGVVHNFELERLQINEHEVEEVLIVPVTKLVDKSALRYTQFKAGYSSPTFVVDNYKIWGVTGFLTNIFLHCLIPHEIHRRKNHVKFIRPFKHH